MDYERLEALRMGAYGAPVQSNVVITVKDMRWLVDQLAAFAPPRPEPEPEVPNDTNL